MHREGGILSTWEGRRGFRASIVVHFCFGEWRIVFDRVDCPLVNPCAYEGLPRLRNEAPEYLLQHSGASGVCKPHRVRRLAGDVETVGALACLLDLLLPALRTVFHSIRQYCPTFDARGCLLHFPAYNICINLLINAHNCSTM